MAGGGGTIVSVEPAANWLRRLPVGHARRPLRRLYQAALSVATLGRGLRRQTPSGDTLYVSPAHRHINWNAIEVDAFRRAIAPGAIAFDVGANVGAYSLLLGRWVGGGGHVFAFEPSPSAFAGLGEHIRLNALDARVTPVPSAVGGVVGSLPFIVEPTAGEGRLASSTGGRATVDVRVTTLDAFCGEHGLSPDFVKVDVEGAELDVLRGARRTIARAKGTLALFVEMHPAIWPERRLTRSDVERELAGLGLRAESLVPGADPFELQGVTARLVPR